MRPSVKLANHECEGSAKVGFLKGGKMVRIGSASNIEELISLGKLDRVTRMVALLAVNS